MAYVAPAGDNADFSWRYADNYSQPYGDAANFDFSLVYGRDITCAVSDSVYWYEKSSLGACEDDLFFGDEAFLSRTFAPLTDVLSEADSNSVMLNILASATDRQRVSDTLLFRALCQIADTLETTEATATVRVARLAMAEAIALTSPMTANVETLAVAIDALGLEERLRQLVSALAQDTLYPIETLSLVALSRLVSSDIVSVAGALGIQSEVSLAAVERIVGADTVRFVARAMALDGLALADVSDGAGAAILLAADLLVCAARPTLGVELTGHAADQANLIEAVRFVVRAILGDTAALTDELTAYRLVAERLRDIATMQDRATVHAVLYAVVADRMSVSDAILALARLLAEDGFTLEDLSAAKTVTLIGLADALSLRADPALRADIFGQLVDALAAHELAGYAAGLVADDAISLAGALYASVQAFLSAPETLALLGETAGRLTVIGRADDTLDASETAANAVWASLGTTDTLAFVGKLPLEDGDYQAWVVNTDTLGVTSYANFPFESVYSHEGRTYGVTETGLYALEGDDDDGEPIEVRLRTGMIDFGTRSTKQVPRAYLYIRSEADAILKTVTDYLGTRREVSYRVLANPKVTDTVRTVKLGRGVRFTSMALELVNTDGADLSLTGAEVLPVVLRRFD